MTHMIEVNAHALATSKFEGGNEVTIASNDHHNINEGSQRKASNVQADAQVDALLFNVGDQIASDRRSRLLLKFANGPLTNRPAMDRGFPHTKGKVRQHF